MSNTKQSKDIYIVIATETDTFATVNIRNVIAYDDYDKAVEHCDKATAKHKELFANKGPVNWDKFHNPFDPHKKASRHTYYEVSEIELIQ